MGIFPQVSIQGFPLESFLILLGAYCALALYLTRGSAGRASAERAEVRSETAPNVVLRRVSPRAEPQPAADERKLAA